VRYRAAFVIGVAALALLAGARDTVSASPTPALMTFLDPDDGLSLTMQITPAGPGYGHFVFRVDGRGTYVGEAGSATRSHSSTSVTVNYEGPATFVPTAAGRSSTASVRLQAEIDPAHAKAQATLREAGAQYHLVAKTPSIAPLQALFGTFEDATVRADARALYSIASADIVAHYTPDAFAQALAAQLNSTNRVTALRRTSTGALQISPTGLSYVIAAYQADYRSPTGAVGSAYFDVYFGFDGRDWKLFYTRPR
jgi:hypothetical protein